MTFPNVKGEVPGTHTDIGICTGRGFSGIRALTGVSAATEIYMHNQATPPQGYTLASSATERMLTVAASSTAPGGSQDPTNLTGLFGLSGLTDSAGGIHYHSISSLIGNPVGTTLVQGPGTYGVATAGHYHSGRTDDQNIDHQHGLNNGNVTVTFTPRYNRGILVRMT